MMDYTMTSVFYEKFIAGKDKPIVSDGMTEMALEEKAKLDGNWEKQIWGESTYKKEASDGSSADYYKLPKLANELQDLISDKNMNAQIGEIFRECYRYGQASHSDELRGIKKILFYANAELKRLTK